MRKRVIQVPIDNELLDALDSMGRRRGQSRSRVIREACSRYLAEVETEELDAVYQEGYKRKPEEPILAEAQVKLVGRVLPKETW